MADIKQQTFTKNELFNLSSTSELEYSRLGYDFYRWLVVSDDLCVGVELSDGQELSLDREDLYLSAIWNPIQYEINYQLDGGTQDPRNPDTYDIETSVILYPATDKENYEFQYWCYSSTGLSVENQIVKKGTIGNLDLSAVWKIRFFDNPGLILKYSNTKSAEIGFEFAEGEDEVLVEFNKKYNMAAKSNGNGTATVSPEKLDEGDSATWNATPDTGYHFTNWSDGSIQNPYTKYEINGDVELSANFSANRYYVAFDGNGGDGSKNTITCNYNEVCSNCLFNNPPDDGFERSDELSIFNWWLGSNGVRRLSSDEIYNWTSVDEDIITLSALWCEVEGPWNSGIWKAVESEKQYYSEGELEWYEDRFDGYLSINGEITITRLRYVGDDCWELMYTGSSVCLYFIGSKTATELTFTVEWYGTYSIQWSNS